ncbi:hypothetical protein ACIA8N_21835 [Streptomyces sp. NPDC051822]|uniref:hypothetical protein n=1 Tax=Streptomyces sp. NPDC051822 TaxID=3365675 RepID=UPI0037B14628
MRSTKGCPAGRETRRLRPVYPPNGLARSNRAKADRDPAEWMPPLPEAHCRYVGEWTAMKLRWDLAADQAEADALTMYTEACETTVVHYTPAP